jgi:hypothetical protein
VEPDDGLNIRDSIAALQNQLGYVFIS